MRLGNTKNPVKLTNKNILKYLKPAQKILDNQNVPTPHYIWTKDGVFRIIRRDKKLIPIKDEL